MTIKQKIGWEIVLWFVIVVLLFIAAIQAIHAQPLPPALVALPPSTNDATVTLAWDPSPDTGIASYLVQYGTSSGQYVNATNFGLATNGTVGGLTVGVTYFFVANAIGTNQLMSTNSNEVSYLIPELEDTPAAPDNFGLSSVPVYVMDIYSTDDLAEGFTTNASARFVIISDSTNRFFTVSNRMEMVPGIKFNQ